MKHEMNLQTKYFRYIKHGTKRIELRLYDDKRRQIQIGDTIIFSESGNKDNRLETKVIGLLRYATFEDLLADFDISMVAVTIEPLMLLSYYMLQYKVMRQPFLGQFL